MNSVKTVLLLGGLSGFLLMMGQAFGGQQGLVLALGMAVVMNFASYFFSEKLALSMSGAIAVNEQENAHIWRRIAPMTRELCRRMDLPMPRLWVLPEASPNAFATGRNPQHSSVAVSAGLLETMNDQELEAVIAHELAHILNRDILISSIAATIGAAITSLARFAMFFGGRSDEDEGANPFVGLLMMILAPIAALLVQMAISRTREYAADATAAKFTGSPSGMVNALRKLEAYAQRIPMEASPAMSHMYIFPPSLGGLAQLFSTHPTTEKRIAALMRSSHLQ
ncbi:MAG: zinc metalloprotease HtpX [Bryobacter sp.]|nr:zinc metalloprotease HtpX [Bryobacter sp.]